MPAASNSNLLSVGREVVDMTAFGDDVPDSVRNAFDGIQTFFVGAGWPCGAESGDTSYQLVLFRGGNFYGGNPGDPLNPNLLGAAGGGEASTITFVIEQDGSIVGREITGPFILGAEVDVTDECAGTGSSAANSYAYSSLI